MRRTSPRAPGRDLVPWIVMCLFSVLSFGQGACRGLRGVRITDHWDQNVIKIELADFDGEPQPAADADALRRRGVAMALWALAAAAVLTAAVLALPQPRLADIAPY